MNKPFLTRCLIVGAVIVLLIFTYYHYSGSGSVPQVSVVPVLRENLNATITSNGKIEAIDPAVLHSPLNTFVERIHVAEGHQVKRGQLLVELDDSEARTALARAKDDLLAAEEDLRAARVGGPTSEVAQLESDLRKNDADLTRLRHDHEALARLFAKQAATQDEIDRNKVDLEHAEAQDAMLRQKKADLARRSKLDIERASLRVQRARDDIRAYEEKVASSRVTSPLDGTLYSLPVRLRDFLHTGDIVAEVADLNHIRIRAFVDEPEIASLEEGQKVEITWDAAPGRLWMGKTVTVPSTVVARGSRSVGEVLCTVENAKRDLLPNINVNVLIRVRERVNVLVVPRGAVRVDGTKRYVYVIDGRYLRQREIKVGIASATKFEVLSGVTESQRIALPGEAILRDGLEVSAVTPQ